MISTTIATSPQKGGSHGKMKGCPSVPGLNLKIDGNQSFQTNAEKWAQSEATEINSLNPSSAISPIYDGPVQSERN